MLSLRKVVVGSSLFSVAILLAACNSSGGGSSKPQPAPGSDTLNFTIKHPSSDAAHATNALGLMDAQENIHLVSKDNKITSDALILFPDLPSPGT